QKPIRILDAIKWDPDFETELKKGKFKRLPKIGPEHYSAMPLGFDSDAKVQELQDIIQDIKTSLGESDALGKLLVTIAEQYIDVVQLLLHRGSKEFWTYSKKLYGSPKDRFHDESTSIRELGEMMYQILNGLGDTALGQDY